MRDMHRERLTHLLATAIVELWKKETGSLSSVVIEGTICITSGTGKTTVLQVADRFSGSIPEAQDGAGSGGGIRHAFTSPESNTGRYNHNHNHSIVGGGGGGSRDVSGGGGGGSGGGMIRSFSMPQCYSDSAPRVDCQNQTAMAAFLDNLSPASLVSPGTDYSRSSRESRSPANTTSSQANREPSEQGMDVSSGSIKDENLSESGSDNSEEKEAVQSSVQASGDGTNTSSTGGVCPGTGYYTCKTPEMNNNTIDPKYAHKVRSSSPPHNSPERNKRRHSRERSLDRDSSGSDRKRSSLESPQNITGMSIDVRDSSTQMGKDYNRLVDGSQSQQQDAVDLTRKGVDDLALSPPQSYTAQVRDVIRQKLLAGKQVDRVGDGEESPSDSSSISSSKIALKHPGTNHIISTLALSDSKNERNTPKVLETLGLHRSESECGSVSGKEDQFQHHHKQQIRDYSGKTSPSVTNDRDSVRVDGRRERESSKERDYSRERGESPSSLSQQQYQFHQRSRVAQNIIDSRSNIAGSPDELRISVNRHATSPSSHPLLISPISPIMSSGGDVLCAPNSLPSPSSSSPSSINNGSLQSILRHRPFPPIPLMQRSSLVHTGPKSAPPLFTHPGFSPLQNPHHPIPPQPQHSPRDASPSPTDLSLDSSGDSEKELGPNGEQRVYRCEFCTKTFLFKSKYHEHLPVHTNARPFQCHLCSRTYKYKYDLRVHLRTHMGIPTKSTVCPFCNTKFDTNKRLRVHIKDAHKDKQKLAEEETNDRGQLRENASPAL